ncbi:hypothetical protein [Amycolatopsis sp. NPDC004625]|uniref:hypothetical protein n=1 Tax=Amycolatopsis sp. NPDC004625 TaxID=3154670 RepID=UPI0033B3C3A3
MSKKDHKVEIWTTSGGPETTWMTEADARIAENLPFKSTKVVQVKVTVPKR